MAYLMLLANNVLENGGILRSLFQNLGEKLHLTLSIMVTVSETTRRYQLFYQHALCCSILLYFMNVPYATSYISLSNRVHCMFTPSLLIRCSLV